MDTQESSMFLRCSRCKNIKSINDFHKNKRDKSGRQTYCIACHKIIRDIYRYAHRDENNVKNRIYYANHRIERHEYYENHKEEKRAYDKIYVQENKEKVRSKDKAKRARKKGATVEKFIDKEIFERDGWICQLCHKKVNKRLKYPRQLSASLDHIVPLSKGGEHSRKNCCLAHLKCNVTKQNRSVIQQTRLF